MKRFLPLPAILLVVLLIFGCSGKSGTDPLSPDLLGPAGYARDQSSHVTWGLWEISIEPAGNNTGQIEIVPLRTATFNVNVQQFLTPPSSPVNLIIVELLPDTDFLTGYVRTRVGLRHPFPGVAMYRGFDVRGIVMMGDNTVDEHDSAIIYGMPLPDGSPSDVGYLMNPDGYTRWWNPIEFTDSMGLLAYKPNTMGTDPLPTCSLNAYKYFADELDEEGSVASLQVPNRGTFSTTGNQNTRIYDLQFPIDPLNVRFNLAIDASWDEPDPEGEPDGYPVEYFPPSAQVQEPYYVEPFQYSGSAFYADGISGGSISLEMTIYDWQAVGSDDGVPGQLNAIWLSGAPLAAPVDVLPLATSYPGMNEASSVFQVELDNSMLDLTSAGEFYILGAAESAEPTTYMPQIDGGEAFDYPDGPLAAYFMPMLYVSDQVPQFEVLDPNGGETVQAGSDYEILWTGGEPFEYVDIEYSKDDFVDDINVIIENYSNSGLFLWEDVPDDTSETVKVRVSSSDYPQVYDDSDGYFTIVESLWERIVYYCDGPNQGRQIYTIDPEGLTQPECWSNSSAMFNECAKLSPNGDYILYTRADMSFAGIWLIDIATGVETNITPTGYQAVYADFSHDGTEIVAAMTSGAWYYPKDLFTFDYNGQNVQQLTTGADVWAPEYSWDDSMVVYQRFNGSVLYIYDFATGSTTQYCSNGTWNDCPHFSPDDSQIAWSSMYGMSTGRHIWVSPVTGWNPPDYQIDFSTYIRSPCFNPEGTKISFDWGSFNESEIGIYTISTGTYVNITSNGFGEGMTDWGYLIPH